MSIFEKKKRWWICYDRKTSCWIKPANITHLAYKLVWIRDFHFSFKRLEWDRACLCGLGYKTQSYSCKQWQRMMHNNQSSSLVQLNSWVLSFCSLSDLLVTGNKLLFTNPRYSSLTVTFYRSVLQHECMRRQKHTLLRMWMMSPSFKLSSSSFVASKANVTLQYSFAKKIIGGLKR